jgi:hypothetical protein
MRQILILIATAGAIISPAEAQDSKGGDTSNPPASLHGAAFPSGSNHGSAFPQTAPDSQSGPTFGTTFATKPALQGRARSEQRTIPNLPAEPAYPTLPER